MFNTEQEVNNYYHKVIPHL